MGSAMDETDHLRLESMLYEIDERGEGLTVWEVRFVADLVDRGETRYTPKQAAQLEQIYAERCA